MSERKQTNLILKIVLAVLALLAAALLLLCYASMVVPQAKLWYLSVFGLMSIPIIAFAVIMMLACCRKAPKFAVFLLILLLPSISIVRRNFQLSSGGEAAAGNSLKIMTYNVGGYNHSDLGTSGEATNKCMEEIAELIKKENPDIACFQEAGSGYLTENLFKKRLDGYYYHRKNGSLTISKFPIADGGFVDFENSSNMAIFTDIQLPDAGKVRVYNCHFQSYQISPSRVAKSMANGETEEIAKAEVKIRTALKKRSGQVDEIAAAIDSCGLPVIVTGDFNDTPVSYTYTQMKRNKQDTFVKAGKGFGATFSLFWPAFRIDYIFCPKTWKPVSHKTIRVNHSDHYPCFAVVTTAKQGLN